MADAIVVGAGQSGLIAARLLAEQSARTTVIERLPGPGGQEPEGDLERELTEAAERVGVRWLLGTLAVRWDGTSLETLGVEGAQRLGASVLVLATGTRPATRGELSIAGDRCAGIVPATAAIHLLDAGVLPGRDPLVYGGGGLAAECARKLSAAGARSVTVVSTGPPVALLPATARLITGWRVVRVAGVSRTSAVWIERGGNRERLAADALLLAHGRTPMRNVEGAVGERGHGVIACHSAADPKRVDDAEATAEAAVAVAMQRLQPSRYVR